MEREEVERGLSNIGERIARARRDCGFTRREMGELVGVDECVVRSWEETRSRPTLYQVRELAARCGTTPEWLLGRDLIKRLLPDEVRLRHACQADIPRAVLPLEDLDAIRRFILWVWQQLHRERTQTGDAGAPGEIPAIRQTGELRQRPGPAEKQPLCNPSRYMG